MSPRLENWKTELSLLPEEEAAFEQKFFLNCAKVLLGPKCGELVMLRESGEGLSMSRALERAAALCRQWGLRQQRLYQSPTCTRILVYDARRLNLRLDSIPSWVYHEAGFSRPRRSADFVAELGRRWESNGQIPHAIGLVLDYPLKDVLGFMNLAPLECTGSCGWRIYGDPEPSLRQSRRYREARRRADAFLDGRTERPAQGIAC